MSHQHRFCVVAQARTGSEYFTTRLHAHPSIACHRELYNRRRLVTPLAESPLQSRLPSVEARDRDPLGALHSVFDLSREAYPERTHFGFKLFLSHPPEVRRHVRTDARYRLIVVERRNKLAQYASFLAARKTRQWGARADAQQPPPLVTVTMDVGELARYIQLERQRYSQFRGRIAGRPDVLEVFSEDLDRRFADVLAFLGVEASLEVPASRVRQNPGSLESRITNWPEVAGWLDANGLSEWAAGDAAASG